jgi:hypothetical protein
MARLSDIVISNPQVTHFADLEKLIAQAASDGVISLEMDVKPDYIDTPRNWAWRLEGTFYRGTSR